MSRVTMADVANEAGVSKSTVSQFINKRYEYMGENTKKKIDKAIKELGYQPNYLARSLKQKRTSMIGVIIANIMHRFSTEVSRSIEDFCHKHNMHAILCNADDDPEKEKKYIEVLRAKQVDGLIIFPTGKNIELYEKMINEDYPVVFMDRKIEGLQANVVIAGNKEATYEAINHFLENGHNKIAIATPPLNISPRIDRLNGYKQALHEAGIPLEKEYMVHSEIKKMKNELEKLFNLPEPPTALLAGNDLVFLEILEFFKEKQIKVGIDTALIVFDNLPFAHLTETPVTTIAQPGYEMGQKAADLLIKKINSEKKVQDFNDYVFPCELIIRESSQSENK
ncbi:substrate-binding domain-containing protein [Lederbergia lenta]|uniref:LacI family transcriptional regulator n=1 Tax=Lederbergia lenta TaxID=1467 RepID=A0A2X4VSV7_LEDLE|nr:substrate-binding domain-containing protein [Lederbergia lenta]MCM3113188.1 substrate-binding domain-containing protein [Lederbergia lenta]MEC2326025.1 substrate-binding domain-containing protein [Lederbergia lenta]SQI53349.1 lacI family transcriptional regulator [Lederbergia lenta]